MAEDYEVGYRKPPKRGQFKKGQSGNANGRPKGTKNLKTDLLEEFSETIVVREGDRKNEISKQRALIKSLMARALNGDDRPAAKILDDRVPAGGVRALRSTRLPAGRAGTFRLPRWAA